MDVRTVIVGGRFYEGALDKIRALKAGEELILAREPSNPYDKNAVAVMAPDGAKLGHVPAADAPLVARAMDRGIEPKAIVQRAGNAAIAITWEN
jgi:SWI/SNF-related matrix-associated actin-dependent regulator of chromatin subfamily A3